MQNRESGLWIPAAQHAQHGGDEYEEDEEEDVAENGEARGREEEREVAAA